MARRKIKPTTPEAPSAHEAFVQALRAGTYSELWVKREGRQCYLAMKCGYEERVFVNRKGKAPDFHHAWQIREWLEREFGILAEAVEVRVAGEGK